MALAFQASWSQKRLQGDLPDEAGERSGSPAKM